MEPRARRAGGHPPAARPCRQTRHPSCRFRSLELRPAAIRRREESPELLGVPAVCSAPRWRSGIGWKREGELTLSDNNRIFIPEYA